MSVSLIPLYCLAAAAALIYLPFVVVAFARLQIGLDYSAPRAMFDKLPPYAQRATWAHQNAFESFPLFAAAVLMVYLTHREGTLVNTLAIAYLPVRLAYSFFYIADIPPLRSAMWALGMVCISGLMAIALRLVG